MRVSLWMVLVVVLLAALPAHGQFVQYAPPGDFTSPAEAREKTFERAMERARWRFGRLLVDPWVYLRNISYQDNQASGATSELVSDVTVSAGAGLNTYMTLGSDFIWGTFLLPEYTWWQDLDERNRLNGRYGTGLFGNLGRLGVETTFTRFEQSGTFSNEVEQQTSIRQDRGELKLDYDLGKGFLLFAEARDSTFSSLEDDPSLEILSALDRDETIYRGGVGFQSPRGVKIGIGFEQSEVEFDQRDFNRSNSGDAIVLDLVYDGPLFLLNAQVASRKIEPEAGSDFVPFDSTTGSINLGWRPIGPARIELYSRRNVAYSIQSQVSYIETEGAGVGIRFSLGSQAGLRVFGDEGQNTYLEVVSGGQQRVDDLTSYGLEFDLRFDRFTWQMGVRKDEYESNLPGFDREFTRFTAGIGIGGARSSPWG